MARTTAENIDDSLSVRLARAEDLSSILDIECASPTAAHWLRAEYEKAIAQSERLVLVATGTARLLGFLVAAIATEEWELENIAVAHTARRRGVGRALMKALIVHARTAKAIEIRQEIRASNSVAQQLGHSVGFQQEGRRTDYYRSPTEDALLFKYLVSEPKDL